MEQTCKIPINDPLPHIPALKHHTMRFGVYLPNYADPMGDVDFLIELAQTAESAGWDGFFLWDHIAPIHDGPYNLADPFTILGAIAVKTKTIKLATTVTPVSRRRPWKLAREVVTLDHLSRGRVILGIGLGGNEENAFFGETWDLKTRAAMTDEALEILRGLWTGEPFSYEGQHYQLQEVQFLPKPYQDNIPIWIGGFWPYKGPFRRAAKHNGTVPLKVDPIDPLMPDDFSDILDFIKDHKEIGTDFSVAALLAMDEMIEGNPDIVTSYEKAGVTWLIHSMGWWSGGKEAVLDYVRNGPPAINQ